MKVPQRIRPIKSRLNTRSQKNAKSVKIRLLRRNNMPPTPTHTPNTPPYVAPLQPPPKSGISMKMVFPSLLVLFLIALMQSPSATASPKVCIPNIGCIQGTMMPGYRSDKFEAFMGIPFAKPPIGNLRFANPEPIEKWDSVLNVSTPRPDCIQKNYLLPVPVVSGEEDCLYLNIYRPCKKEKKLLPVMVYIYGGGFFSGTASPLIHGPEYFMDTKEVILVTVAYRLGALGFLSTGDGNMPGNFGLKDQNMALRFVQKHISAFGGNPNSVTIFGQSAGAVSVHMHILSDLSKDLFHKAIVMSGNAGAPFAVLTDNPLAQARKQAEFCKIPNAANLSTAKLTKALRQIEAKKLVESGDEFKYWHVDPLTTFRPVVEASSENAFLSEDPVELIASGRYSQKPWMTGVVPHEGAVRALSILSNDTLKKYFNAHFDELLEKLLEFPPMDDVATKMNTLIDFYFKGAHELNNRTALGLVDIVTDRAFLHPFYQNIKHYVETADLKNAPVYLYKFNYRGSLSYSMLYTGGVKDYGVVHCDDLIYLFRSPALFGMDFAKDSTEAAVIKEMVDTYVSFAQKGHPKRSDELNECNAEALKRPGDNRICEYREIKNEDKSFIVQIDDVFDMSKVRLWDSILN